MSIVAITFNSNPNTTRIGKYKVMAKNGYYVLITNTGNIILYTNPFLLFNKNMSFNNIKGLSLYDQVIYSFDPLMDPYLLRIIDTYRFNIYKDMGIYGAVLNGSTYYALPVLNCDNSTDEIAVIEVRYGNETRIIKTDNCFIATISNPTDLLMLNDYISLSRMNIDWTQEI